MQYCAAEASADFVSDCADVVCADRFLMRRFLSAIAPKQGNASSMTAPLRFSHDLLTGNATTPLTCGAVNLTPWAVGSAALGGAPSVGLLPATGVFLRDVSSAVGAAGAASGTTRRQTTTHQWRLNTLVALAVACVVLLCANGALIYWAVLPKRRRLQQRARESQFQEPDAAPA